MSIHFRSMLHVALLAAAPLVCASAFSQDFPSRPIKVIVPYPAGGGSDVVVRYSADKMQELLKQPIVVENKPGAGSVIGSDGVVRSPADGYTLLFNIPALIQAPVIQKKVPFDPINDLIPITTLVSAPVWFAVNTNESKAASFQEFVEEAKKVKNGVPYGSWGVGTTNHLYSELLMKVIGVKPIHIAYKGASPSALALVNGEVTFLMGDYVSLRPFVDTGKVRILASTGPKRHRLTPDVPTFSELGYPGFESVGWGGYFAPKGTPADVVAKLQEVISTTARDERVARRLLELGFEPGGKSQQDFAAEVKADSQRWKTLIEAAGIQAE
jgi:tripartite-type tricarboxylate transporter receptor subunit TctC